MERSLSIRHGKLKWVHLKYRKGYTKTKATTSISHHEGQCSPVVEADSTLVYIQRLLIVLYLSKYVLWPVNM